MGGPVAADSPHVLRYSEASLPTEFGEFRIAVYRPVDASAADPLRMEEHVALYMGDGIGTPAEDGGGVEEVFCRVHSECFTSEVLGSLRCDCREQLDRALARIAAEGCGALIYLRQEGRGIGLGNKIRAYELQQEKGHDTVDANEALGFEADLRSFALAASMLRDLGVATVRLNTNNVRKIRGLEKAGIPVTERIPAGATVNMHNRSYLRTKRDRLGHLLGMAEEV